MKYFKSFLLVSVAVFSTGVKANIPVITDSISWEAADHGFVGMRVAKRNQKDRIKDAAVHAAAAYNDRDLVDLTSHPLRSQEGFEDRELLANEGHEVISFSASIPGRGNVPAGIVTYKETPEGRAQVTVAFHGSESVEDFTEANLRAFKKQNPAIGIKNYIHGGFSDRYNQSREALFDVLDGVLAAHGKSSDDVDFTVTGHSLGGALATLGAADIKSNLAKKARVDLVTFSSPRVFDHKGAQEMEHLLGSNRMLRIWRAMDPVPMISLGTQLLGYVTGFKHVGQSIKLDSTVNGIALTNHSLDSIKNDALSDDEVKFDANHVGYSKWFGSKISSGFQKVKSWFGY